MQGWRPGRANIKLPLFSAVKLSRLPPVDVEHVDVSAILHELSALRHEVRAVSQLREEIQLLKTTLQKSTDNVLPECDVCKKPQTSGVAGVATGVKSFAELAQDLSHTQAAFIQQKNSTKKKPTKKITVGVSTANKHVKSVPTSRCVDVFVSRLHPLTTSSELIDCVQSTKNDIDVIDIECHKLKSKREDLYASFHVAVRVDSTQIKKAIDLLMSPESWPAGVFIKKFFKPKNGSS